MTTDTIRDQFNRANPNDIADLFRRIRIGDVLGGQIPQALRRQAPAASAYVDSTLESLALPGHAKGASILRATVIAGGVTGEFAPQTYGTTPGSGQCAVAPNGDLVFLAADAVTSVDVTYVPERGEEIELVLPVDPATGILEIPASYVDRGVLLLSEAESLAGTLVSEMEILVPTSSAPATGNARLSIPKARVYFAVADAVTKARVKLVLAPRTENDLASVLASAYSI